MTKAEILKFAWNNGACIEGIQRFQNDEPLENADLYWAYKRRLDLGDEVYLRAVSKYGPSLQHVPEELRTHEICREAVNQYGWALKHVPEKHKTYELCIEAVKEYGPSLLYVPEEHKSFELCLEAVKKNGWAMQFVPEEYKQQIKQALNL